MADDLLQDTLLKNADIFPCVCVEGGGGAGGRRKTVTNVDKTCGPIHCLYCYCNKIYLNYIFP